MKKSPEAEALRPLFTAYPVFVSLVAPAFIVAGLRTAGRWGAAALVGLCFTGLFAAIARVAPPLLVVPALGVDVWYAYRETRGGRAARSWRGFSLRGCSTPSRPPGRAGLPRVAGRARSSWKGFCSRFLAGMVSGAIGYFLSYPLPPRGRG